MTGSFEVNGVEETWAVARRLAAELNPGDVVCLEGDLGAGKTTFTQGLAAALGVSGRVNSPTFCIVQEHRAASGGADESRVPRLVHMDLYRLHDESDVLAIGWEDYLSDGAILAVEWPDRAGSLVPATAQHVIFTRLDGEESRRITLTRLLSEKRLVLFAGHYGSGKTNVALNYARALRRTGADVTVADLDIVNPYFRTKDSAAALSAEGIGLVVSDYANSNVDFPALPKEIYSLTAPRPSSAGRRSCVVMDIGGDDRGALALGRYVPDIRAGNDYEMLAVVNAARPLTQTVADTVETLREIEAASHLPFTGLVNNTNVGPETTAETVLRSLDYANGVSRALRIPVRLTTAASSLADALRGRVENLFPLDIQRLYYQLEPGADPINPPSPRI